MSMNHDEVTTGFNDLKQVEMSIEAAKKMVGYATMSMDPEQLEDAMQAVSNAKSQLESAKSNATGVDDEFLTNSEKVLSETEHQLNEAKR